MKVGDRVEILRRDIAVLKHRFKKGKKIYGFITEVNGFCLLVRPAWQKHEMELYETEIRLAKNKTRTKDDEIKKNIKRTREKFIRGAFGAAVTTSIKSPKRTMEDLDKLIDFISDVKSKKYN